MVCSFASRVLVFAVCAALLSGTPTRASAQADTIGTVCANPNQDAHVISAVTPTLPSSARDLHGTVVVLIELSIGSDGAVKDATVYKSSANRAMDAEALRVARASMYAPKIVRCVQTTGSYLFRVDFRGKPLTPPVISAPQGWKPGRFNDKSQYATTSWSDVPQHQLIVRWELDPRGIDEIRNMELNGPLPAQRVEDTHLCNGTQRGFRFFHGPTGPQDRTPSAIIEVMVANGVMYTASYLAYDHAAPTADVQKALDSFCAPEVP